MPRNEISEVEECERRQYSEMRNVRTAAIRSNRRRSRTAPVPAAWWGLLEAVRGQHSGGVESQAPNCALNHTAMPLLVCTVIQITTNRAQQR